MRCSLPRLSRPPRIRTLRAKLTPLPLHTFVCIAYASKTFGCDADFLTCLGRFALATLSWLSINLSINSRRPLWNVEQPSTEIEEQALGGISGERFRLDSIKTLVLLVNAPSQSEERAIVTRYTLYEPHCIQYTQPHTHTHEARASCLELRASICTA